MFSWLKAKKATAAAVVPPMVEGLESRALLSASGTPHIVVTVVNSFPAQGIAGEKFNARIGVNVANDGAGPTSGPYTFTVYASLDQTLTSDDAQLASITRGLHLNPGANRTVFVRVASLPTNLDGSYYLLGGVVGAQAMNAGTSGNQISITPAHVDLVASIFFVPPKGHIGGSIPVGIALQNLGNADAKGTISFAYGASATPDGANPFPLATLTHAIHIKALGKSTMRFRQRVPIVAGVTSGNQYITVTADSTDALNDNNRLNNFTASLTPVSLT